MKKEEYLKEIYILESVRGDVRVTDVAIILGISKASVNKAIHVLKEQGYVNHKHYGTIKLTPAGKDIAKGLLDTYNVAFRFLTDILNIEAEIAECEAHQIEYILSSDTSKKLEKFIETYSERNNI